MRALLPLAVLAAPAVAQQTLHVPDAKAATGKVNLVPLGGKGPLGSFQNLRAQIRVPAGFLPAAGSTIQDLGFAVPSAGSYSYGSILVRLSHLKGTTLTTTFDANLADSVTVLSATSFKYALPKADAFHPLKLTGKFVHDGKRDLVVDITIQKAFYSGTTPGSRRSDTLQTVYALGYDRAKPAKTGFGPFTSGAKLSLVLAGNAITYYGTGCKGSNAKVPQIRLATQPERGKALSLQLGDARAQSPAVLRIGQSDRKDGALTLPLDLGAAGATGCSLLSDMLFQFVGLADAQGALSIGMTVPNQTSLKGRAAYAQWIVVDGAANRLGLVLSQGLRTTVK